MKELSKAEETILLAIYRLKEDAYGVSIRKQIMDVSKKEYTYGTLYGILEQLAQKNYVIRIKGEPTPERGGRGKTYYKLTQDGLQALRKALDSYRSIWDGITELSLKTS